MKQARVNEMFHGLKMNPFNYGAPRQLNFLLKRGSYLTVFLRYSKFFSNILSG